MTDNQNDASGPIPQPEPNLQDQKRNSNRSKDSEILVGEMNKIIRMKKQMKKNKLEVQDKIEKAREKSPVSQIGGNKAYLDLKAQFTAQLPKLISLDTRQAALKELENIIEQNKTPEGLRVYLSSLSEYKRPQNFSTNEAEVFLLGLISDLYGANLIDVLDNPPSLLNASLRLGELVSRYFKDQNENVQRQCCKTWKQIYRSQLLNASLKQKMMVLYEIPSSIILGGKDRVAQITAVMAIESILDFSEKVSDKELASAIAKKYLPSIYFKMFLDTPSLIVCARQLVSTILIKNLQTFINQIIEKTISFLIPQENRPIQYKIKIEVCDFLTIIARQLQDIATTMIGQYQDQIIPILQECTKDRMLKVQSSAKQALKEWQTLKQKVEELEKKKLTKKQKPKEYIDPDEIINQKTSDVGDKMSQLKKRPKQQTRTIVLENDQGIKNVLSKQGGWVNELKAKNFIRKQTGVGGGRTVLNEDRLKVSKTAINQQQKLRDYILGQYKDVRDELKSKKMESEQQLQNLLLSQDRNALKVEDFEDQENQPQNQIYNNLMVQKKLQLDNATRDNLSNNFYNSQLPNLQNIQSTQQQLVEEQLKLYPQDERKFVIPPQSIYPTLSQKESPFRTSGYTQQRYQEAQPEFLVIDDYYQSQYSNNNYQSPTTQNNTREQMVSMVEDPLEETQDFNNLNLQEGKQQSQTNNTLNKPISQIWEYAIQLVDQGEIDEAFSLVLDSEDDIYFIRLLMRTGMQIEKLKRHTAVRALQRYLLIQRSNFVNNLCLGFYQDSVQSGLQDHLTIEDQRETITAIEQLSQSSNHFTSKGASNVMQSLNYQIPHNNYVNNQAKY